jgi:putative phosphoesterase
LRVAALYDIHGNLPALDAVLAEVDAEVIVVGGDFTVGLQPAETVERLRSLDGDIRFIRGNAERELVQEGAGLAPPELLELVRRQLSAEQLAFVESLPLTTTVGEVLFCHATPRNDEEILTRLSSDDRWRDALGDVDAELVVCGHTHVQFDRRVGDIRLVNAGSVGMPYEDAPGAYWALLDGADVELRRTEYDSAEPPQASAAEASEYFERMSLGESV